MNKFIYILLGGVIGASATYAYMNKKIKVAQKKAEEDIVEMRKYYNEKKRFQFDTWNWWAIHNALYVARKTEKWSLVGQWKQTFRES